MSITIPKLRAGTGETLTVGAIKMTFRVPTTRGLYVESTALCSDSEEEIAAMFNHVRAVAASGPGGAIERWIDGHAMPAEMSLIRAYLVTITHDRIKTLRRDHGLKLAECAELLQSLEL